MAPQRRFVMFKLTSTAVDNGRLDIRYGINSGDASMIEEGIPQISFPFEWSGEPEGTKSYAIEYMDYDNAEDEGVIWIHWIAAGIPADRHEFAEGEASGSDIIQGHNSWALPYGPYEHIPDKYKTGYGGPAPGHCHTYELTIYALDNVPELKDGFFYADMRNSIEGHILDKAVLKMKYGG